MPPARRALVARLVSIVPAAALLAPVILGTRALADEAPAAPAPAPAIAIERFTVRRAGNAWLSCLSFRNVSARPVSAVEFAFDYIDAFDTSLETVREGRIGPFAPGALVEPPNSNAATLTPGDNCWAEPIADGTLARVTAQALKVRFADGEIAAAPPIGAPVFVGQIRGPLADHPKVVTCWLGLKFDWESAQNRPSCWGAIKKWRDAHPAEQLPEASPPAPSPT